MKKVLYSLILSSCLVLSACTTSRGLAPVAKFFNETNGSVYREYLDSNPFENSEDLKKEFDNNKKTVLDLREKTYSPLSIITGSTFEKDLVPVDEFLHDESGEKFAYGQWIAREYEAGRIIDAQKTARTNELESIKALVHKLATGQEVNVEEEKK